MDKEADVGGGAAVRPHVVTTADLQDAAIGTVVAVPGDPIQMPTASSFLDREFRAKICGTARKIYVANGTGSVDTAFQDAIKFEEAVILFLAGKWSP